jgi:threonine/homoserine/homoserine lactone efflux protein
MDPTAALVAGLVAGLAIAAQFGAVSLLLVETAVVAGPRLSAAAGLGVATVDLAFAGTAAAGGSALGAALATREEPIRIGAAAVLAALALHGLIALCTGGRRPGEDAGSLSVVRRAVPRTYTPGRQFARFVAITAANPLTIASFAAIAAALSLDGPPAAVAFAVGAGTASAGWHLVLALVAGHAGRWITPAIGRRLAIAGRLTVLAIAAHLVLGP